MCDYTRLARFGITLEEAAGHPSALAMASFGCFGRRSEILAANESGPAKSELRRRPADLRISFGLEAYLAQVPRMQSCLSLEPGEQLFHAATRVGCGFAVLPTLDHQFLLFRSPLVPVHLFQGTVVAAPGFCPPKSVPNVNTSGSGFVCLVRVDGVSSGTTAERRPTEWVASSGARGASAAPSRHRGIHIQVPISVDSGWRWRPFADPGIRSG